MEFEAIHQRESLPADEGLQTGQGHVAKATVNQLAILAIKERGDGRDAIARGEVANFINVYFQDGQIGVFFRKFFDDGGEHVAGAAPGGKEVDKDVAFG